MEIFANLFNTVHKLALWLIDFLIPREKSEKALAEMTAERFLSKAKSSLPFNVSNAKALFSYKDRLVKDAIWLLKYRQNRKAAEILGTLLGNVAAEWLEDLATFENFNNPLLVPIPMGKIRRAERGSNHCEALCEEMLKAMPLETVTYAPLALSKIRETASQARTKNRAERLKNLSGSFNANPKIVRGRNILLIDDVITTGATIDEARRTLQASGASKIYCLTIAH
ncbi:MAG TPA: phosphoribosyltransferase family protein [Candidatus Paceibacterota bacterium]